VERSEKLSRVLQVISVVFGTPAWLLQVYQWIDSPTKDVQDAGVWFTAAKLVSTGRLADLYDFQQFREVFAQEGFNATASLQPWVFSPQHAVILSPIASLPIRVVYIALLVLNAIAWWWMLRSIARTAHIFAPEFWTSTRQRCFRCVGWMFAPAAFSGILAAFACLIVAAIWLAIRDTLLVHYRGQRSSAIEWANAGALFLATIKPQMVWMLLLGLLISKGHGRAVAVKTAGLVALSSAGVVAIAGPQIFVEWVEIMRECVSGTIGAPPYVWWSPLPQLTDRIVGGPPATAISALVVSLGACIVGLIWMRANHRGPSDDRNAQLDRMMAACFVGTLLTYVLATYQSHYDTVVTVPALGLAFILHSRMARKGWWLTTDRLMALTGVILLPILGAHTMWQSRGPAVLSLCGAAVLASTAVIQSLQPKRGRALVAPVVVTQ
jgi:hypothetical protein